MTGSAIERPSKHVVAEAKRRLGDTLGEERVLADPDLLEAYAQDESASGRFPPDLVVRAKSRADVVTVFDVARALRIPVTPRGLGSGKAGGALPVHGGIVLSLEQMRHLREIDRTDMLAVAEPGIVTGDLMSEVERHGLFYPPDPNSLAICSLGGNVACNAGGPRALKYGVTRGYVLGLEVVLPNGETLRLGHRTIKGVAGYDLVSLIVGSEGTLGVITEITVRLLTLPVAVATALVSFSSLGVASSALGRVFDAGIVPRTLELLDENALFAIRSRMPGRFPDAATALIILETDGSTPEQAEADLERAATECLAAGATDVVVAQSTAQRERVWEPRRILSTILTESAPRKLSEDIVVPRSRIPEMLTRVQSAADRYRLRVATYGHAGDGNLHVNVLFDDDSCERANQIIREIAETAVALGGTISGEHGIGLAKRELLPIEQSEGLIELQRNLKSAFDPLGILNPGKVFPSRAVRE